MFSAQHYNFIAKRFREQLEPLFKAEEQFNRFSIKSQADKTRLQSGALVKFAVSLAEHFKKDNENFDPIKFLDACSPDSERYPLSELWDAED